VNPSTAKNRPVGVWNRFPLPWYTLVTEIKLNFARLFYACLRFARESDDRHVVANTIFSEPDGHTVDPFYFSSAPSDWGRG
jgi:hypothetical protein